MLGRRNFEAQATLEALNKSQAVIEFKLDGTIITANGNFLNALNYSLEEVRGKHHSMFVEPGFRNSAEYKEFWATLNRGEFNAAEFKRIGKNGKEVWIQASYNPVFDRRGKPFKVVKYATDVTAAKLRNADYQGQMDAINKSQAVIEFDLDGAVQKANDNFLKALGYTLSEVQDKHHSLFVEPEYRGSPEYREFWAKLKSGEYQAAEYKRIGKGGREVWIQASYNPIFDMNGVPFKVVKYATDITLEVQERHRRARVQKGIDGDLGEISDAIDGAAQQASGAAGAASQTSGNVQAVATAAEEMSASINEISRQVAQAREISGHAVDEAARTNETVGGLAGDAQKIGEIVKLISDIAGQTHLLALNATIEAARAGEAGKGFAVVASEVKGLADQTARATEEISQQIGRVQTATEAAVKAIGVIGRTIGDINEISSAIAAAVEEQSAVTNDVVANMQTAAQGVDEISRNMDEIARGTGQVQSLTAKVRESSQTLA